VFGGKSPQTRGKCIVAQLRPAGDNHASWFTGGVRVDELN
jgi:hypothetical protein